MNPVNKKFKTLSTTMTEFVGLMGATPWDEQNVYRTQPQSSAFSFDSAPACKKSKLVDCLQAPSTAIQNIFIQRIKQNPAREEQILTQYKRGEKSTTLFVNKQYHRLGLRERLGKKSLPFDQEWQRKEMLRHEEHIIKKADEVLLTNKELTNTLCLEILDLSDETFHALLLSHPNMSLQSINILITTAWAKNAEGELQTEKQRKFISLAHLCALPKLLESQDNLRSVLSSYHKLLAIDHDLVVENILFPFMQQAVPIPKTLLEGINTHLLLRITIDWIASTDAKFNEGLVSNFQVLLEHEQEYFEEPTGSKFLKVLEFAIRSQPRDLTLATLLLFVVKKFIHSLRDTEIKFLQCVNDENHTLLRGTISKILLERMRCDGQQFEPMDTC